MSKRTAQSGSGFYKQLSPLSMPTARREFEVAKLKKADNVADLVSSLQKARRAAQEAQRALDEHITTHHCEL